MFRFTIAILCSAALLGAQDDFDQQLAASSAPTLSRRRMRPTPSTPNRPCTPARSPAMLRKLDPHSVFFDPEQFEQLKRMETSDRPRASAASSRFCPGA